MPAGKEVALTDRERDVLKLVLQGKTNRQIGLALYISRETVKRHVRALLRKFEVTNRLELAIAAAGVDVELVCGQM